MVLLDTPEDWRWWIDTWQYVLDGSGIQATDRILMAFSFGPFIGFWSAHDACLQRGCMVIPSGGLSTAARVDLIVSAEPTVIFSTPSYVMHIAEEANRRGMDLSQSSIQKVFVAGEPGGSTPQVRSRIERMFGAQVTDHAGATEVGPWGFGTEDGRGLHVIESEFIAEFLPVLNDPTKADDRTNADAGGPIEQADVRELVLTSLGRIGAPVFRYRTGDLVRPVFDHDDACRFVRLEGGVVGRADDMLVIRGVNVFPTSIDAIVRSFDSVSEYRLMVKSDGALDELQLQVEDAAHRPDLIADRLLVQLNLRVDVIDVPASSLPRVEGKARRVIDQRR